MTELPFSPSAEVVFDFSPERVARYLALMGWDLQSTEAGFRSIFALPEAGARLMLPLDSQYDDFRDRMRDALRIISSVHKVRGQELALEIASATSDITFLRADQYLSEGSIPIKEAENLLSGARAMMTAAALSALRPKGDFGPARPSVVKEFINEDVRMGHTMRGSFVITILTNLDDDEQEQPSSHPAPRQTDLAEPELSFNRRVMTTLATGLHAATELLKPDGTQNLDEAVELGVSAQLVASVETLTRSGGIRSVDTSFKWSPSHSAPSPDVPDAVSLPRLEGSRAKDLQLRLRQRPDPEVDQVIGPVIRLERATGENNGVAVIDGYVGKQRKRVRVELAPSAYKQATEAHEARRPVIAEGDMTFSKGSFRMANPRAFREVH